MTARQNIEQWFNIVITWLTEYLRRFLDGIQALRSLTIPYREEIRVNFGKLRIFMVPTLNIGVVYYRMENFVNEMRALGHQVAYRYHPPEYAGTCQWEHNLTDKVIQEYENLMNVADIAIFQAVHTPQSLAVVQGIRDVFKKPVLAEYDDDIFAVSSENLSYKTTQPGGDTEWYNKCQIQQSDGTIVSTDYLKKRYRSFNKRIFVIPNAIDFKIWDSAKRGKEHKRIRIGWVGGASHSGDLRLVKDAIYKLLDRHGNIEIYFHMGGLPEEWMLGRPRFHAFHKWFTIDKYPQGFAKYNFDIGIAPLRDTEFNRSKSNLRFLEFSALKIPTVCSRMETYEHDIEHGKNGLLARESEEWFNCLDYLIKNEKARKKMGRRAYDYVKKRYNVQRATKKYIYTLRQYL